MDTEKLWRIAVFGSPMVRAMALCELDEQYEGEIMKRLREIKESK